MSALLEIRDVCKAFGGVQAVTRVSLITARVTGMAFISYGPAAPPA